MKRNIVAEIIEGQKKLAMADMWRELIHELTGKFEKHVDSFTGFPMFSNMEKEKIWKQFWTSPETIALMTKKLNERPE